MILKKRLHGAAFFDIPRLLQNIEVFCFLCVMVEGY